MPSNLRSGHIARRQVNEPRAMGKGLRTLGVMLAFLPPPKLGASHLAANSQARPSPGSGRIPLERTGRRAATESAAVEFAVVSRMSKIFSQR
jgi:hypothetical protein